MAKKSRLSRLQAERTKIQESLDRARLSEDPSRVSTQIDIAGLTANYWLCQSMIAGEEGKVSDEHDCEKRHQEAMTQFARLKSKEQADLLPKILARLAELDADEGALQSLALRRSA